MTRRPRAFTLVELVMVLAVVAILAGIAAPKYAGSLAGYRSLLAARQFAADLGAAQSTARATSTSQTVAITQATATYTISTLKRLDSRSGTYTVKLGDAPYYATISGLTLPTAVTAGQIKFDGFGVANTGATVTIANGGRTRTVTLDATTGAITVQ